MTKLEKLARERWIIAGALTLAMIASYFGFILLIAFNKPLMSTLLTQGLTLGILLGVLVIVSAWILTLIYVVWANGTYDNQLHQLRHEHKTTGVIR